MVGECKAEVTDENKNIRLQSIQGIGRNAV